MILKELASHIYELAGLMILLACSAFFSGSETALFSLNREDLRKLKRSDDRSSRCILAMLRFPQALLGAVLLGNMVVNVMFFSLSFVITIRLADKVSSSAAAVSGAVSLFAVILLGEVSPKGIAVGRPVYFARAVAPVLYGFYKLARPVSSLLRRIAQRVTGFFAARLSHEPYVTRGELKMLAAMAEQQGVLERDARSMIQQVMELASIRVREVMTPRVDVVMFPIAAGRERFCELVRRTHEERIVVYEGDMDNILGMIIARDVFMHEDKDLRQLLRPVRYVPEMQTVESLLRQFREARDPVAIVVDEFGGTAGLVNQEQILEEVVGEIRDEFEPPEEPVQQLDEDTYILSGDLNTREWRELLGAGVGWPGVETLGGLVAALLGRIPGMGDSVEWRGLWFTVEKMAGRRVDLVRVERIPD